jgi:hypothetical protein
MLETKITGKPYAGKLHVRIDEGVEKSRLLFSLYSTASYVYISSKIAL